LREGGESNIRLFQGVRVHEREGGRASD